MFRTALALSIALAASAVQAPQPPQVFSTRIVLVPVDVRVVDRDGKPVTDLKREDFSITEDGSPQQISQFSMHDARSADGAAEPRTFMLVLGRGRLQEPAKGIDAAVELVRDHLLPADRIALFAYDRVTEFTTNHAAIVGAIERFRERHGAIEAALVQRFETGDGRFRALRSKDIPPSLQADIDAIFDAEGVPPIRQPLLRSGVRPRSDSILPWFLAIGDWGKITACIDDLRTLEGEKHVVWLSTRLESDRPDSHYSFARKAADARVVLHVVQTSGVPAGFVVRPTGPSQPWRGGPAGWSPDDFKAPTIEDQFRWGRVQQTAAATGGLSSLFGDARAAVARIEQSTRFHYLLGYTPIRDVLDETYREIAVTVKRPGVTVFYRHGYAAHRAPSASDERTYVTQSRMLSGIAGATIPIRFTISQKMRDHQRFVDAEVRLDPATVLRVDDRGRYVATLDIAIFASDKDGRLVGESWDKVPIDLSADAYARLQKENLALMVHTPVTSWPDDVKAIVYDYDSDTVGAATKRMQRP